MKLLKDTLKITGILVISLKLPKPYRRKSNYDIDDNAVRNEDNYTNRSYAAKRCESQPNLAST